MKNIKTNLNELENKLSNDHPNAFPDHPCLEYECYYDYLDTLSDYHFDRWRDDSDSDDVDLSLKFRGECIDNIMDEVLPFEREQSKNVYQNDIKAAAVASWYLQNEIGSMSHVGYKQRVDPERHPTLQKIVDWFEYAENVQPIIMEKNIGNWEGWHVDSHCGHPNGYRQKELHRVIIHLQDWQFGQMLFWGTKPIMQWRAGDCLSYNVRVPHVTANCSRYKRYSLRITGVPSEATKEKVAQGGIINVDEL